MCRSGLSTRMAISLTLGSLRRTLAQHGLSPPIFYMPPCRLFRKGDEVKYRPKDGTHYVVGKRPEEPEIVYLAEYSKDRHPHAKEAAEAECARLNAEHRKEQA